MFPLLFARDRSCHDHDHVCDTEVEAERKLLRSGHIIAMSAVEPLMTSAKD